MKQGKSIVLNRPTAKNLIGFTSVWMLWIAIDLALVISSGPFVWQPWRVFAQIIVLAIPVGILVYIAILGGKSVTVTNDAMLIELWISQIFNLRKIKSIHWDDILDVTHIIRSSPKGRVDRIVLSTAIGRIGFSDLCFDHLGSLRNVLVEKLGKDRINVVRK